MKNKIVSFITIFLIIILSITCARIVYAKYLSNVNVTDESANPSIYIIDDTIEKISLNLLENKITPGNTYSIKFDVNNFKNSKRTENIIDYTIKLEVSNNLPLEFELYKNNEKITFNNYITEKQTLNNTSNQTDKYELKIKFIDSDNSYEYAKVIDYIDILVESSQRI